MDLLTEYENYIESLCAKHKQILHGSNSRKTFIKLANDESADVSSKAASPYVKHTLFAGAGKHETQWIFISTLEFLVNVRSSGALNTEINNARAKAMEILEEFDARIRFDYEEGGRCSFMESWLEPTIEPIGMTDNSAFGFEYTLRFGKERRDYDDSKWND